MYTPLKALSLCTLVAMLTTHSSAAGQPPAPPSTQGSSPPEPSTLDERSEWLISLFKGFTNFHPNPKIGLAQDLAKLAANDGNAPDALQRASRAMDFRFPGDTPTDFREIFTYPGLTRFLYMFGGRLSPEQLGHLKATLVARAHDLLSHGTENHAIMRASSAYLLAQYFPDAIWTENKKIMTSAEMMLEAKNLLLSRGRGFYHFASAEMVSTTYSIVNIYPLLNLCEFAGDPEVRNTAAALAIYHLTQIALNDYDGHAMPAFERQNSPQARFGPKDTPPTGRYTTNLQQVMWLLWDQNKVVADDFLHAPDAVYPLFFALSHWRAPSLIDRLAAGEGTPYWIRGVTPVITLDWGSWDKNTPDWIYRTVWRDRLFAIGGGACRFKPAGYYLDNNMFNIVWASNNRFNYLECTQPYWRSNEGEDDWDHGTATPFEQMGIGRHSAIVLFDIPAQDPWPGVGDKRWTVLRDQHSQALLQVAQCRFPKSVDEVVRRDPWFFIREGDVYIGIRPLSEAPEFVANLTGTNADFYEIKCRAAKTGFVFEVGDQSTHGSFKAFQAKVPTNLLDADLDNLDVTYSDSHNESLRVKYNQSLTPDANGYINTIPSVWNNGTEVTFTDSPVIDSAPVTLRDGVLSVSLGNDHLTIDWSGRLPKISLPGNPSSSDGATDSHLQ